MGMSPRAKLLAQALVAGISMLYGFQIHYFTNPLPPHGYVYLYEPVTIVLTLLWYIGMMNAINFIDGLDGLLSGLTVISAVSLIAVDLMRGHTEIALILAALAGSALGFLRYNWNPAKIILGDSGALFIGYVFATVSIIGASKTAFAISLLVPLVVLALPVLDTAAAIVRRTRAGKKIYEADRAAFGELPNFTRAFSSRPAVYAAWRQLNASIKAGMDLRRYELATIAAARRLRSSYCMLAHGSVLANQFLDPQAVQAVATDHRDAGLDAVDVAVMDLAEKVADDATSVTEADVDHLRSLGLSDADVLDVVLAAAARCFFSKVLDGVGAEPDAKYASLDSGLRDALAIGRPIAED